LPSRGHADAIASSLSGLESLIVRSPMAATRFTADVPDLAGIGAALEVGLVLVGFVLRAGDRVRVSAQLVETPQGTLRWTTTAETTLDDMFRVLDGLVRRIVESLALPSTVREARGLEHDVPGSGHAFELYLRANRLGRIATPAAASRSCAREWTDGGSLGHAPFIDLRTDKRAADVVREG
jgi:adenylate cyclase